MILPRGIVLTIPAYCDYHWSGSHGKDRDLTGGKDGAKKNCRCSYPFFDPVAQRWLGLAGAVCHPLGTLGVQ